MFAKLCLVSTLFWTSLVGCLPAEPLVLPSASSLDPFSLDSANTTNLTSPIADGCFDSTSAYRLVIPEYTDCLKATHQILTRIANPKVPHVFARWATGKAGVNLPKVFFNETCVVSLDVERDKDEEKFPPFNAWKAALKLVSVCVDGETFLGGKVMIGPKKLVTLLVFGRKPSPPDIGDDMENTVADASGSRPITARSKGISQNADNASLLAMAGENELAETVPTEDVSNHVVRVNSVDEDRLNNSAMVQVGNLSIPGTPSLSGEIMCYDAPTQRELGYPINVRDCEQAVTQIIGNRDKMNFYLFSRRRFNIPSYFPMPARFTHGSCVAFLDMVDDRVVERVRLTYVESSAWVLMHKCSGEEVPEQRYGGSMTVGVGANNRIRVYVYGLRPPSPGGAPLSLLPQNGSFIDYQRN
ncbi:hypothetical protein ACLMJK_002000 [Lecanora helva]